VAVVLVTEGLEQIRLSDSGKFSEVAQGLLRGGVVAVDGLCEVSLEMCCLGDGGLEVIVLGRKFRDFRL
jgi:hypothetical protein